MYAQEGKSRNEMAFDKEFKQFQEDKSKELTKIGEVY